MDASYLTWKPEITWRSGSRNSRDQHVAEVGNPALERSPPTLTRSRGFFTTSGPGADRAQLADRAERLERLPSGRRRRGHLRGGPAPRRGDRLLTLRRPERLSRVRRP